VYDDSNTDACDVTVIATGIGTREPSASRYEDFKPISPSLNSRPAAQQQQKRRPVAPAGAGTGSRPRRPASSSPQIPSFLNQPKK